MKEQGIQTWDSALENAPTDDIVNEPILEIQVEGLWVMTDKDIWGAWTGMRRRNGVDFHGDVHLLSNPDKVWTGSRCCFCKTCQAHVEAKHRPN